MSILGIKQTKSRVLGTGLGAAFLLAATAASAADITVTIAGDVSAADSECTLREAIESANTNPVAPTSGCVAGEAAALDTITFAASVNGPITLANGALETGAVAAGGLAITGPMTIDANEASRIFTNSGNTTLTNLTLVNGLANGMGNPANSGGAILNTTGGVLTATGGAMNNNTSVRAGGAIEEASGAAAGTTAVTLNNVNFSGNDAGPTPGNGGALHVSGTGDIVVNGGTFDSNTAQEGGALWNGNGAMTVTGTTATPVVISNNIATCAATVNGPTGGPGAGGGGIFNIGGTLTVAGNTTITNNQANGPVCSGGGINTFNNSTLNVNSGVEISSNTANRAGGGIEANPGSTTVITGATLTGNTASTTGGGGGGNGGALHITGDGDADITSSTISSNIAATEGGGLWNNTGTMFIDDSDIINNVANGTGPSNGGGGIFNNAGNSPATEGPSDDGAGGFVSITGSTITGNSAPNGSGSGGGILNNFAGEMAIFATTIANNSAQRAGGGIETRGNGSVEIELSSLLANAAGPTPGNGGGLHVSGASTSVTIDASLVSNNTAASEGGGLWNDDGVMGLFDTSVLNNTASGDDASNGGGGIFANRGLLRVFDGRIAGNVADGTSGSGGGVFTNTDAFTDLDGVEISANTANRAGGGIENIGTTDLIEVVLGGTDASFGNIAFGPDPDNGSPGNGGGLHNGAGDVTIDTSSVGFNTANEGGGLWNNSGATLSVNNTTVSGNQATEDGGGLYQISGGNSTFVTFSTVARNSADGVGGGLAVGTVQTTAFVVDSSIVAENTAGTTSSNDFDPMIATLTDSTTSADSNALGDYRLFGGLTATHPLQMGSAAIDNVAAADCDEDVDQRGADRPGGTTPDCDSGAFEAGDNAVITVTNNNTTPVTINANSTDVVVLALSLANNGMDAVNVGGFFGRVEVNAPVEFELLQGGDIDVFVDTNGNGNLDADEQIANASIEVNEDLTFDVSFDNAAGEMFDSGETISYLIVASAATTDMMTNADWIMPVYASGTLLGLLGLFSVGGLRRRTRWVLAISVLAVGLTACGGGGGGGGGNGNAAPVAGNGPIQGGLQFVALAIDDPNGSDEGIVGDGMPVRGPAITASSAP